ncbi:MAG: hypothetical protein QXU98_13465 [Candidatus Parvarchaeota archaeon]
MEQVIPSPPGSTMKRTPRTRRTTLRSSPSLSGRRMKYHQEGSALSRITFKLMDLQLMMHIACGSSIRSKKETYNRSTIMLKSLGINLDPVRFDRYYFDSSYVDLFGVRIPG